MSNHLNLARDVSLLALDVDGVLTDGKLYFDSEGDALKTFNSQDGHGLKMLRQHGIRVAIITGRRSSIVVERAKELGVELLMQGREDKLVALRELAAEQSLPLSAIAYMGDDLPDLSAIRAAGLGVAVANSASGVTDYADYVTAAGGGDGAVREVCELLLSAQGKWPAVLAAYANLDTAQ